MAQEQSHSLCSALGLGKVKFNSDCKMSGRNRHLSGLDTLEGTLGRLPMTTGPPCYAWPLGHAGEGSHKPVDISSLKKPQGGLECRKYGGGPGMECFSEWQSFDVLCLSFFILTQSLLLPRASECGPAGKGLIC